ncbi:MAG: hypothetical protein NT121_07115 [Chloroflexi bacterium]|nr:hypothetical protein [Chloroflexota bacterium]
MTTTLNPYIGPRSFQLNETLYGRDRELRQLTDRLIAERIVLLHSPSGAGKTSLVQAGLIPQLGAEGFFVHPVIRVNLERSADLVKLTDTLKDTSRSTRYTFSTLLSLEERYPLEERLDISRLARLTLDEYLVFRSKEDKRDGPEFLIFDQFEEALTIDPTDRQAKNAFFSQLGAALKNRDRWALFAMRTDYVGALEPFVRFVPTYFANTFHLELLGVKAAREAVQKPARAAGVNFTDGAAAKLVDDLRRVQVQLLDGSLETQLGLNIEPVQLQVVCYRLWESKTIETDGVIDEKDLASVGDVSQSLAEYYASSVSKVAENSGITERSIREWFDRKLITAEGIRSQVRLGAEVSEGLPTAAVRKLEDTHLIRAEKRAGQTWYELAHDRLVDPVRSDNRKWFAANLSLFQRQAALWLEQGRGEGLLLRGKALEVAEKEIKAIALTPDEGAYFEACQTQRKREIRDRNQRRIIFVALVISFMLLIAASFFAVSARNANKGFVSAASTAQSASTQAIFEQANAQAASTQAIAQQSTAQAASTQAISQQATAQSASTQAVSNANAAATQKANADAEKVKANQQEKIAQSIALVAQSILSANKIEVDISNLLAIEAFRIQDSFRTRTQLLNSISNNGRLFLTQTTNSGTIPSIAFGLDGNLLASMNWYNCTEENYFLCKEGVIKLWKVTTLTSQSGRTAVSVGQTGKPMSAPGMLDAIAVSPDGKTIASVFCNPVNDDILKCEQESIILWNAATQEQIGQKMDIATNTENDISVQMVYSPDGKTLAVTLDNSALILWEIGSSAPKEQIPAPGGIAQMAFSPDGKTLAFASDRNINFVDVATGKVQKELPSGSSKSILSLAFSPDGKYLASGSGDGTILLWNPLTYARSDPALTYTSKVTSLSFSPDSKILAAGYFDYNVILWDVESRQKLARQLFKHTDLVRSLAFSADGKKLVSAAKEIVLWDMDPASWQYKACDLAGRNFTRAEWQQYFLDETYRLTCQQWQAGK